MYCMQEQDKRYEQDCVCYEIYIVISYRGEVSKILSMYIVHIALQWVPQSIAHISAW